MTRVSFRTIGQWPVLCLDFTSVSDPAEAIRIVESAKLPLGRHAPGSILSLTDVTGSRFNADVLRAIRALLEHNRPYVHAGAVVGLSALQRAAYGTLMQISGRRNLAAFATVPEAEAWLAARTAGSEA